MTWRRIGSVLTNTLTGARLELHWGTQLVSAAGTSLLAPEPDFSHTNAAWDKGLDLLAGRSVGAKALRAGLVFEALELVLLDSQRERASLRLAGHTLDDGRRWLAHQLEVASDAIAFPTHDLPSHAVGEGGLFSEAHAEERRELAAWFANAARLLEALVADEATASAVRCWPHHFDLASLIALDRGVAAEDARSIGVGFSPGDSSYGEPYFYVTPWPYPETDRLPSLEEGARWHIEGWTGAVLTADALVSVRDADRERSAMRALRHAIEVSRTLLAE